MSRDRFRRLERPRTGDLFAHFGIALDPVPAPDRAPIVEAVACARCGWYVATGASCPQCGLTGAAAGAPRGRRG